jgi:16S rRNA (uracil1498-N3)-methyltransferase
MVLPLFFSPTAAGLKAGDEYRLAGEEGKHAATVKRLRVGEKLQLTDGVGVRILASVLANEGSALQLIVENVVFEKRPELGVTLVQALAKGDRDELAIQAATELGATSVVPWQANRCVSKWEGPKIAKGVTRWQTIVTEAAKQSLRVWTPKVENPVSTSELALLVPKFDQFLVLDPTASTAFKSKLPLSGTVAIVVGPEGGIDSDELVTLEAAGAVRVHLGSGILRTSTAGLAAISSLMAFGGAWDMRGID